MASLSYPPVPVANFTRLSEGFIINGRLQQNINFETAVNSQGYEKYFISNIKNNPFRIGLQPFNTLGQGLQISYYRIKQVQPLGNGQFSVVFWDGAFVQEMEREVILTCNKTRHPIAFKYLYNIFKSYPNIYTPKVAGFAPEIRF